MAVPGFAYRNFDNLTQPVLDRSYVNNPYYNIDQNLA